MKTTMRHLYTPTSKKRLKFKKEIEISGSGENVEQV
jgi:hypothetical protein